MKHNKDKDKKNHPKYELFDNILALDDTFPKDLKYIFHCLLKVGKFKTIQDCNKGYQDYKTRQPGDDYEEDSTAQFNNTHMSVDTIKEYQKRDKRTKKEDKVLFEKHGSKRIKWLHMTMMMDSLVEIPDAVFAANHISVSIMNAGAGFAVSFAAPNHPRYELS